MQGGRKPDRCAHRVDSQKNLTSLYSFVTITFEKRVGKTLATVTELRNLTVEVWRLVQNEGLGPESQKGRRALRIRLRSLFLDMHVANA